MDESYFALSAEDRLSALQVAATQSGRAIHLLEKDVMVVWAIDGLFSSGIGEHLVFKGGTSLSKAYGVIDRFSEDIDVTYDVRQIIPELAKGEMPLPKNTSQAAKWRDAIDAKLATWVNDVALPILQKHAEKTGAQVTLRVEGTDLFVDYDPLASGYGYVPPIVKIEFGARSTGEPAETKDIVCDAAEHVAGVVFPTAKPRVMLPKRTFWEKATAVHVFSQQSIKDEHISRHWHDLVRLDDAGYADEALADRQLAKDVAEFKSKFFRAKDRNGNPIDYMAAVSGKLQLVPTDPETLKALAADYKKMADDGILLDEDEDFETLLDRCRDLEKRANEYQG
ncbi:hypothetical protein ACM41_21990 [Bradyrhizobium sp. CCBAU 21362]|uniref:nucleotidyl transferase AbiEii/AbiGii toxin family protein n=1 Tax=Bradyrhizobium sp. CCBAU 21362 TaxID=1325082 RepID=UPI00230628A9|nr:nucleotidyl transferase AbiEii/AbiGii toxin family protein [Bradyrhizobium sp. CCBAU 21362]MDA9538786.1 hypothetical protein [Bradyrhizobium sp. CCBAU 21362]